MAAYIKAGQVKLKCEIKYLDIHPKAGTFAIA